MMVDCEAQAKFQQTLQTRSHCSGSRYSRRSDKSTASAVAAKARAKAEEACARASLAEKEMAMKVDKVRLETTSMSYIKRGKRLQPWPRLRFLRQLCNWRKGNPAVGSTFKLPRMIPHDTLVTTCMIILVSSAVCSHLLKWPLVLQHHHHHHR